MGGAYGEEVCGFAGAVHLVPIDMFSVRRTPCSGVVAAGGMFNFDDFRSVSWPERISYFARERPCVVEPRGR